MQLFVSGKGFVYVVPMKSKGEFTNALKMFAKEIGVLIALILDPTGCSSVTRLALPSDIWKSILSGQIWLNCILALLRRVSARICENQIAQLYFGITVLNDEHKLII